MGFFDRPPTDEIDAEEDDEFEMDDFDRSRSIWLGGAVPAQLLLAVSDDAAVTIKNITAFPDGFEFALTAHRRGPLRRYRRGFHGVGFDFEPGEELTPPVLRFGLEFADGWRGTNLDDTWPSPDAPEPDHGLEEHGGGGNDRRYTWEYWAWPLPTDGPLAFVCEWPAHQIGETRLTVEAREFAVALDRARPVWPDLDGRLTHSTRASYGAVRERLVRRDEQPEG